MDNDDVSDWKERRAVVVFAASCIEQENDGWMDGLPCRVRETKERLRENEFVVNKRKLHFHLSFLFFLLSWYEFEKEISSLTSYSFSFSFLLLSACLSTIDGERLSIRRKFLPTSWFASKKKKGRERMSIFQAGRQKLLITCCSFSKSKTISNDDVRRKKQTNAVICLQHSLACLGSILFNKKNCWSNAKECCLCWCNQSFN